VKYGMKGQKRVGERKWGGEDDLGEGVTEKLRLALGKRTSEWGKKKGGGGGGARQTCSQVDQEKTWVKDVQPLLITESRSVTHGSKKKNNSFVPPQGRVGEEKKGEKAESAEFAQGTSPRGWVHKPPGHAEKKKGQGKS